MLPQMLTQLPRERDRGPTLGQCIKLQNPVTPVCGEQNSSANGMRTCLFFLSITHGSVDPFGLNSQKTATDLCVGMSLQLRYNPIQDFVLY